MPKKLDPITRANKDLAEYVLGHRPGRPTFSRRTGGVLSELTGVDEDLCVHAFHALLIVGGAAWLKSRVGPKRPPNLRGQTR